MKNFYKAAGICFVVSMAVCIKPHAATKYTFHEQQGNWAIIGGGDGGQKTCVMMNNISGAHHFAHGFSFGPGGTEAMLMVETAFSDGPADITFTRKDTAPLILRGKVEDGEVVLYLTAHQISLTRSLLEDETPLQFTLRRGGTNQTESYTMNMLNSSDALDSFSSCVRKMLQSPE